jgi:hypothetical protein
MRRAAGWLPLLLPLLLTMLLAACSRQATPAAASSAQPAAPVAAAASPVKPMSVPAAARSLEEQQPLADELMRALFGDGYLPERGIAVIRMVDDAGRTGPYAVSPVAVTRLADGRTVVVANAADSNEAGEDLSAHASPGVLNVYLLKRDGGAWTVLERHEHVAELGSSGSIGSVAWAMVGPDRPGFIVSSGGSWQGSTILGGNVYDLSEGVRSLGEFSEHSDNGGACTPETEDCWEVDGAPRFVAREDGQPGPYWDIQVDYTGRHYTVTQTADGKNVEHLKSSIRETGRYRFDGKVYKMVAGTDPVPGI